MSFSELVPIVETQVKERLTGAVILVALIVLLVPELLTGGPTIGSTPQVQGSDPGAEPVRTVRIDLVDGGVRQTRSVEADLSARALRKPAPDPEANVAQPADAPAARADAGGPTQLAAPPLGEATDTAKSEPAAVIAEEQVPAVAPAAPKSSAAHPQPSAASSSPPASPPRKLATASASAWAVQLGSFAKRDNAQRLVKRLKAKGYSAFVTGGGGGKLYKVRVGPQPDKAAATSLAAKLRTAGFNGSVVSQ